MYTLVIFKNLKTYIESSDLLEFLPKKEVVSVDCSDCLFNSKSITAKVVFKTHRGAQLAVENFNNRELDCIPMSVFIPRKRNRNHN